MAQEFIFEETFIRISYDPEEDWIYADWRGFQRPASMREGCEQILLALKKYRTNRVLNDNTHVEGIWSAASEWIARDWFPRMRQAGLQYFAWVYSTSILSQLSTDKTLHLTLEGFVRTFYDVESARHYLRSLKKNDQKISK
jgi:hypothetical protein